MGGKLLELRPPLAQWLGYKLGFSLLQQIEREKQCRSLDFTLDGEKLRGGWILTRMRKREGEKRTDWLADQASR